MDNELRDLAKGLEGWLADGRGAAALVGAGDRPDQWRLR